MDNVSFLKFDSVEEVIQFYKTRKEEKEKTEEKEGK